MPKIVVAKQDGMGDPAGRKQDGELNIECRVHTLKYFVSHRIGTVPKVGITTYGWDVIKVQPGAAGTRRVGHDHPRAMPTICRYILIGYDGVGRYLPTTVQCLSVIIITYLHILYDSSMYSTVHRWAEATN
jgi:hypothetical protein